MIQEITGVSNLEQLVSKFIEGQLEKVTKTTKTIFFSFSRR